MVWPVTLLRAGIWKDKREGKKGKCRDYLMMIIVQYTVYNRHSTKALILEEENLSQTETQRTDIWERMN